MKDKTITLTEETLELLSYSLDQLFDLIAILKEGLEDGNPLVKEIQNRENSIKNMRHFASGLYDLGKNEIHFTFSEANHD